MPHSHSHIPSQSTSQQRARANSTQRSSSDFRSQQSSTTAHLPSYCASAQLHAAHR